MRGIRQSEFGSLTRLQRPPASEREYLASRIAALLAQKGEQRLHLEFLWRGCWFTKTIDTMEFRGQD